MEIFGWIKWSLSKTPRTKKLQNRKITEKNYRKREKTTEKERKLTEERIKRSIGIKAEGFEEEVELEEYLQETSIQVFEEFEDFSVSFQCLEDLFLRSVWWTTQTDTLGSEVQDVQVSFDLPGDQEESIHSLGAHFTLVQEIVFG